MNEQALLHLDRNYLNNWAIALELAEDLGRFLSGKIRPKVT
jgi:hypothetical protein